MLKEKKQSSDFICCLFRKVHGVPEPRQHVLLGPDWLWSFPWRGDDLPFHSGREPGVQTGVPSGTCGGENGTGG